MDDWISHIAVKNLLAMLIATYRLISVMSFNYNVEIFKIVY